MPSASNKTENKASVEVSEPFKAAQTVVEKKVRNLEKRKGKLDAIREKRNQGEQLNDDQQKAIDAYDSVLTSLDVTKELQKQFGEIQAEIEKQLKKQARKEKKERAEKRASEVRRFQELLQLQSLLDCMGTDQVRSHFKTGKHNAKILSDESFTQLDEFYKLLSPNREEANYEEQLSSAAEHVYSYLEGRDAEAAGSTYIELKKLVDDIAACGYFDNYPYEEVPEVPDEPVAITPVVELEQEVEQEKVAEEPIQKVVEQRVEETVAQAAVVVEQVVQHVQHSVPPHPTQHPTTDMTAQLMENDDPTQLAEDDSFFSTPTFPSEERPFQDIVSSVQGTFNFLQESQIAENSAAAILAATSFQGVSMLGNDDLTQLTQSTQQQQQQQTQQQQQQPPQHQAPPTSNRLGDPANTNPAQQSAPLDTAYTSTPQDFSQNLISQNLATNSTHVYGDQTSALGHTHSHTHSNMDQSVVMGTGMSSTQDMSHAIPQPTQSFQDQGLSQDAQGKKTFTMNPNAAMFTSMYNSNMPHSQNNSQMSQSIGSNNSDGHSDKGMNQQNDYHSNGFGGRYGDRSGGPRGPRGGGRGGRGNMSNGYARNGSRGGGQYNNSGRGNFNSRGGGGRGGTSYHGYPPRSDYRPEGGYQGFNNTFNTGNGYKRGGNSGAGSNTGAGGTQRGGGTGMRGGPPRGGSGGERGGRGAPRGSYGSRPPMHQST